MEPGPTAIAPVGLVEFRCRRIQKTTGRRCSKLLAKGNLSADGFSWIGHMTWAYEGAEAGPDYFHTRIHAMEAAVPIERTMEGIDRWSFKCHRRCGNRPTITLARAKDEAERAVADGENAVYI